MASPTTPSFKSNHIIAVEVSFVCLFKLTLNRTGQGQGVLEQVLEQKRTGFNKSGAELLEQDRAAKKNRAGSRDEVIVSFTLEREEKIKYSGETFIFLLIIYLNNIKNSCRLKKGTKR